MTETLRASNHGLEVADQARKQLKLQKQNPSDYPQAITSQATLKRFWRQKPIEKETFIKICLDLKIEDWRAIAESRQNFREAPKVELFCGRNNEITSLKQWILEDKCQLITILGIGGIGKTSLTVKLTEEIQESFDYVIWKSIREEPKISQILPELMKFISEQEIIDFSGNINQQITLLIEYFTKYRCLIIFDNVESILQEQSIQGEYKQGYADYSKLFQEIGKRNHQSCLILTSRETPKEIISLQSEHLSIRCLNLQGLKLEAKEIIQEKGLQGTTEEYQKIINLYQGNPKALEIVASHIKDLYGNLTDYLTELQLNNETNLLSDLKEILYQQLNRLSEPEQQVMYWLAINREFVSLSELKADLLLPITKTNLTEILASLKRRSLIEKSSDAARYSLQNVVMEYITEKLTTQIAQELINNNINLANSHAILKAQTKEYIRETQIRLIVQPILEILLESLGNNTQIEKHLKLIIRNQQTLYPHKQGYLIGNIVNLLVNNQTNLQGYDLSNLTIQQAYLKNINLQNVNLANCDLSKSVFAEVFDSILAVCVSPDGKILATGDTQGKLNLWEVATSKPLITLKAHSNWIRAISFSPDNRKIASASNDNTIKIWDISNIFNPQYLHTLAGHTNWIWSIAFSYDSTKLASGSDDKTVKIWDIFNSQCLDTFTEHPYWVRFVAFHPDGQTLVSASADQTVKIWNITTGKCLNSWQEKTHIVRSVTLSPDGNYLATGSDDNKVRIVDLKTGKVLATLPGHTNRVWSVIFSPQDNIIASGSADKTVKLWDFKSGECIETFTENTGRVRCLSFSQDGTILVSGSDDQSVKIFNIKDRKCIHDLRGYTYRVWSVCFTPDNQKILSGTDDNNIRLWDIHTGNCLQTFSGHQGRIRTLSISPDGQLLASGSHDRTIKIWNINTGQNLQTLRGHQDWIWSVIFNHNGQQLISGSDDKTIKIWDLNTGQCLHTINNQKSWSWSIAFNLHNQIIASADEDQQIRIWDLNTGQCLQTLTGHQDRVRSVDFSLDGELLVSGSDDQTLKIWHIPSSKCLQTWQGHQQQIRAVKFNCTSEIVASASDDTTVKLWHTKTGQLLFNLEQHTQPVWSVAFSLDGQHLVTGSEDQTIKLWDVKIGQGVKTLTPTKLYQNLNISKTTGLTEGQKSTLFILGANAELNHLDFSV